MYKKFKIKPPFFEIGPKTYLYGEAMLILAKVIDAADPAAIEKNKDGGSQNGSIQGSNRIAV
ncbi:MAG: hypothetical protein PHG48_02355 [Eubacteriales bacterium]|nr:hypothetical protein [Eubacteriales bacterium]